MDELLNRYDCFLMDLWGVLWDGRDQFPRAVEFTKAVAASGKTIRFVSNCAEHTTEELIADLHAAGLTEADVSWLATSGQAMKRWFAEHSLTGRDVYVFGGESVKENVRRAGAQVHELPEDPEAILTNQRSGVLVIGGQHEFTWRRLQQVLSCIKMAGLQIILPNPDKIVVRQNGSISLPPGMVVEIVKIAVPEVVVEPIGKPFKFIYDYALENLQFHDRSRVLMIGDSLETDILGANEFGIDSLLIGQGVHLGQSHEEICERCERIGARPTYYAEELAPEMELVRL